MRVLFVLAMAFSMAPISSVARDFRAIEVLVTEGKISCLAHYTKYFVLDASGPCEEFTAPPKVRVGETFRAGGKIRTINILIAKQADERMDLRPYGGDLIAKGEWTCVAAESEGDIPSDIKRARTWLHIRHCHVVTFAP